MLSAIEKRRIKKLVYSKVTLIVLIIILLLLARGTWDVYKKAEYANENKNRATEELTTLREREAFLQEELRDLQSARGREAELRKRFDVGREGEHLIVLVDTLAPEESEPPAQKSFWETLKAVFQ